MAVTSATSTSAAASQSAASRTTIANNFDTFLLLLTTQLKNQNPLDPLDTNQFTQQLVQFAGVEQPIGTNESLPALVNLNKTSQLSTAMSYVGATVTADGATSALKQGVATWYLTAPRAAAATINVSDSTGNVVFTQETTLEAGTYAYVSTQFSGVVDAVDLSGSEPLLMIGTALLTMDKIKTVQRPTAQQASSQ